MADKSENTVEVLKLLIEQYKVVRWSITDLQQDRNTNNNFLIATVTVIIGGEGYLLKSPIEAAAWPFPLHLSVVLMLIAAVGVGLCRIWIQWNKAYGAALATRYQLLKDMEQRLPASPFTDEPAVRDRLGYESITSIIDRLARFFASVFVVQIPAFVLLGILAAAKVGKP